MTQLDTGMAGGEAGLLARAEDAGLPEPLVGHCGRGRAVRGGVDLEEPGFGLALVTDIRMLIEFRSNASSVRRSTAVGQPSDQQMQAGRGDHLRSDRLGYPPSHYGRSAA